MAVFLARIVMPFSRSRSLESIARSSRCAWSPKELVWRSMASTRVVLPWSTWATIATLRRSLRTAEAMKENLGDLRRMAAQTAAALLWYRRRPHPAAPPFCAPIPVVSRKRNPRGCAWLRSVPLRGQRALLPALPLQLRVGHRHRGDQPLGVGLLGVPQDLVT